jgi:hypothetical protein
MADGSKEGEAWPAVALFVAWRLGKSWEVRRWETDRGVGLFFHRIAAL